MVLRKKDYDEIIGIVGRLEQFLPDEYQNPPIAGRDIGVFFTYAHSISGELKKCDEDPVIPPRDELNSRWYMEYGFGYADDDVFSTAAFVDLYIPAKDLGL